MVTGLILLAAATIDTVSRQRLERVRPVAAKDDRVRHEPRHLGPRARWSRASSRAATSRSTRARRPPTASRRAVAGLDGLIDDYEFHYPAELSERNIDVVRDALGGHEIYTVCTGLHLDARFGRGGLVSPDPDTRAAALRLTLETAEFAGQVGAHMVCWPGIEGSTTRSRLPTRTPGSGSSTASGRRPRCARSTASRSSSSTRTPSRR